MSLWTLLGDRIAARIRLQYLAAILRQDCTFFETSALPTDEACLRSLEDAGVDDGTRDPSSHRSSHRSQHSARHPADSHALTPTPTDRDAASKDVRRGMSACNGGSTLSHSHSLRRSLSRHQDGGLPGSESGSLKRSASGGSSSGSGRITDRGSSSGRQAAAETGSDGGKSTGELLTSMATDTQHIQEAVGEKVREQGVCRVGIIVELA